MQIGRESPLLRLLAVALLVGVVPPTVRSQTQTEAKPAPEESRTAADRLTGDAYKIWPTDRRKASELWSQAMPLWHAAGVPDKEAEVCFNVGIYYASLRLEKEKALEYARRALRIVEPTANRRLEAFCYEAIASAYYSLGDNDLALRHYTRALEQFERLGAPGDIMRVVASMGHLYDSRRDYPTALRFHERALGLVRGMEPRNPIVEGTVLNNMAHVYAEMGDLTKALDLYAQALEPERMKGRPDHEGQTLANVGLVYAACGAPQRAIEYYERSLAIARGAAAGDVEASTLYRMAQAERELGRLDTALEHVRAAIEIFEAERSTLTSYDFRNLLLAKKEDFYTLAVDVLMRLDAARPGKGFAEEALRTAERGRARTLLDMITEAGVDIRQGVDPALVDAERAARSRLSAATDARQRLLDKSPPAEQLDAATREVDAASDTLREAETELRRRSPRYSALVRPQSLSVDQIRRMVLDRDTAMLYYALGDERSFLWVLTDRAFSAYAIPGRSVIENEARRFHDLASAPGVSRNETNAERRERLDLAKRELPKSARRLGVLLLGAIPKRPTVRRLAVVADGLLNYVPFAALAEPTVWGSATKRSLVEDYEIVGLPSASALAAQRGETAGRTTAPRQLAVFADPVFAADDTRLLRAKGVAGGRATVPNPDDPLTRAVRDFGDKGVRFDRLQATRGEATAILALMPAADRLTAFDFDANRAAAIDPELARYRILHFATHALLDARHPELSGIVLSLVDPQGNRQNGFVRLHDVYDMRLGADLVVLSACSTALGQEIRGEGMIGLTRGFMYAGVPCVVSSLWNVGDRATGELMKRFYTNMLGRARMRPAAALRAAQLSMAREPRWSAPFNWAGFAVQGDWR